MLITTTTTKNYVSMTASIKKWMSINFMHITYLKIYIIFHVNQALICKWWSGGIGTLNWKRAWLVTESNPSCHESPVGYLLST